VWSGLIQDQLAIKGLLTIQANQKQQIMSYKTQRPQNKSKLATKEISVK